MKFYSRKIFYLLILICFKKIASAQINSWNHTHYTTKNGLPSNVVRNCVQDTSGFLWIATESGLCRFDGDEFKTFYHNPLDTTSIPSDYIAYVAMAEDGHLLVSTLNGFFVMNTKTGKGKTIKILKRKGWEKLENSFSQIHINKNLKQIIVNNGTSFHFFDYNYNLIQTIEYPYPANASQTHFLTGSCAYLENGDIIFWSRLRERFEYLERSNIRIIPCNQSSNKRFSYLNQIKNINIFNWDEASNLWYCVHGKDSLFCYNATTYSNHSYYLKGKLGKVNWTSSITFPDDETILMPYSDWDANELYELSKQDLLDHNHYKISPKSFSGFTVASASLFVDRNKNRWISSLDGLYFLRKGFKYFQKIDLPVPYGRKFDWQYVTSIKALSSNRLLITTFAEHCFVYDHNTNKVTSFLDSVSIQNAWNHCMRGIIQLENERYLIFGCKNYTFEKDKLYAHFKPKNEFEQLLANHKVIGLCQTSKNELWVSLQDVGLIMYNLKTQEHKLFQPAHQFTSDKFQMCTSDSSGNVFFTNNLSTSVWKYSFHNKNFIQIPLPNQTNSFDWIRDMTVDNKGNIFINTHQNLLTYSLKDKSIRMLSMRDGIPSNVLNNIFYCKNNLFLSSNVGLGVMNLKRNSLRLFTEENGIIDNACSGYIVYDSLSDRILIGGKGCVYRIHLDSGLHIQKASHIVIDKVKINNIPIELSKDEHVFKNDQNNIQIELSSLDFFSGKNKKYYYRFLKGGNSSEWNLSYNKKINFSTLSSGKYEIEFRSKDADNQWSANIISFAFQILPPWYQTWWFYSLIVVVIGTVLYLIYLNKISQLKRIGDIRNKLSRDLHDDIGSTLSSINILSNTVQLHTQNYRDEKISSTLKKINERSQRLLTSMNDIIWNINPNNDTIEDLLIRMREYSTTIFEAKEIDYCVNFPSSKLNIKISMMTKNNVHLIFKEAVNNLAKYSNATKVSVSLVIDNRSIFLSIQDNGKGFDINNIKHSGGLLNMKKRAEEIQAQFRLDSSPKNGTKIEVNIPF